MKSVLEGRPALKEEIDKIAEVAGYLWQNGWAERNGGNITVNITDLVDDGIKALPAIGEVISMALGFMRSNVWLTTASMFAGKLIRYIILLKAMQEALNLVM